MERVRPSVADTDTAGFTEITAGSRVCYATGMAVIDASRDVREQLRARAAKIWGVPVVETRWEHGRVVPVQPTPERMPLPGAGIPAKRAQNGGPLTGGAAGDPSRARAAVWSAHPSSTTTTVQPGWASSLRPVSPMTSSSFRHGTMK